MNADIERVAMSPEELQALLEDAISHAVVRIRGNPDPGQEPDAMLRHYKDWVLASQQRHVTDQLRLAYRDWRLEIDSQESKDRLVEGVRTVLSDYLHEDRVETASAVMSGITAVGGVDIGKITTRLIDLGLILGTEIAAQVLFDSVASNTVRACQYNLISGIRLESEIQVHEGIRIVPLPMSMEHMPAFLPRAYMTDLPFGSSTGTRNAETRFPGAAVIAVDYTITPRFMHPQDLRDLIDHSQGGAQTFEVVPAMEDIPRFDVDWFCRALSLVKRNRVHSSVHWQRLGANEIIDVLYSDAVMWTSAHTNEVRVDVSPADVEKAATLCESFLTADSDTLDRLTIPIDRTISSWGEDQPEDKVIDIAIALECLYLSDDSSVELSYRLANRCARFLESDLPKRQELAELVKKLYSARSAAVHRGKTKGSYQLGGQKIYIGDIAARAQEVCLQSIHRILEDGFPEWSEVELS